MRIPIAIVMLCLPVAAMGETYICKSESSTFMIDSYAEVYKAGEVEMADYVIDMDSGFRPLTGSSDYRGECRKSDTSIICSNEYGRNFEYLTFDLESRQFTKSSHSKAVSLVVTSHFGKCTEI